MDRTIGERMPNTERILLVVAQTSVSSSKLVAPGSMGQLSCQRVLLTGWLNARADDTADMIQLLLILPEPTITIHVSQSPKLPPRIRIGSAQVPDSKSIRAHHWWICNQFNRSKSDV